MGTNTAPESQLDPSGPGSSDWREGMRRAANIGAKDLRETLSRAAATMREAVQDMKAMVLRSQEAYIASLTPEQRDRVSEARYRAAIAAERRTGLAFVAAEAARVREELGLP